MRADAIGPTRPVVLTAAAAYAAFTLLALAQHGWNPFWFVWIGERWAHGVPGTHSGYDGQMYYYIARDGWAAVSYMDAPAYRFGRMLYPALARVLALGQADVLPWTLLAVSYAAIVAGTAVCAGWLAAAGISPWWGLAFPFYAGTFLAYSRDLTEPLAYALAAGGIVAWLRGHRFAACACFALAGLTRETALLCAFAMAAAEIAARRGWRAAALASTALPLLAWQLAVANHFPDSPYAGVRTLALAPLAGAWSLADREPGRVSALLFIGLPALALTPGALAWLWREPRAHLAWLVAMHCLLTLSLPADSYLHLMAVGRQSLGLLLALLIAFPLLSPAMRGAVTACATAPTLIWIAPVLWWAPWTARL
jgi:hypothetical protein